MIESICPLIFYSVQTLHLLNNPTPLWSFSHSITLGEWYLCWLVWNLFLKLILVSFSTVLKKVNSRQKCWLLYNTVQNLTVDKHSMFLNMYHYQSCLSLIVLFQGAYAACTGMFDWHCCRFAWISKKFKLDAASEVESEEKKGDEESGEEDDDDGKKRRKKVGFRDRRVLFKFSS